MFARIPPLLRNLFGLTVGLWLAFNVYYALGGSGVRSRGGSVKVDRSKDVQLFQVDDKYALRTTDGESFDLVTFKRGTFPVCPVCGTWERDKFVVHNVGFRQGDWFIATYVMPDGAEAFNVRTGEAIEMPNVPGRVLDMEGKPTPAARSKSAAAPFAAPSKPIGVDGLEPLRSIKESCIIFNASFILIAFGLAIAIGVALLRKPKPLAG